MAKANLLITHDPSHADHAVKEVRRIFKDHKIRGTVAKGKSLGVLLARVSKPKEVVQKLAKACAKNPAEFANTFHYIPIEKWVKANVKSMQKAIKPLVKNIKVNESWKLDLRKRNLEIDSVQLIKDLTEVVDRKVVDLERPKKTIQVQVVGKEAGISVLSSNEIFNAADYKILNAK
ncbi:MAG: THUMP domain-containing protein [Candidatus Diapherotrites archaeon]